MKTVEERVAELKDRHARGYNCAQVVLCSYEMCLVLMRRHCFRSQKDLVQVWVV